MTARSCEPRLGLRRSARALGDFQRGGHAWIVRLGWTMKTGPRWRFHVVHLRRAGRAPAPARCSCGSPRAIADDIRRGVLRAGDRLPSTRELARRARRQPQHGRRRVRRARRAGLDRLARRGAARSSPASCRSAPRRRPPGAARGRDGVAPGASSCAPRVRAGHAARAAGRALSALGRRPRYRACSRARDGARVPARAARAVGRAARSTTPIRAARHGCAPRSRRCCARRRGIPAGPENVLITRGSQLALDLAARALLVRPGDVVAVEELGYQPAWRALEAGGRAARPGRARRRRAASSTGSPGSTRAACYMTPHHQYPTTVLLSPGAPARAARARARATGSRSSRTTTTTSSTSTAARSRRSRAADRDGERDLRRHAVEDPRARPAPRLRRGARAA